MKKNAPNEATFFEKPYVKYSCLCKIANSVQRRALKRNELLCDPILERTNHCGSPMNSTRETRHNSYRVSTRASAAFVQ